MNNSDIECPQCGAMVYYELDYCPECGLDFYPPDDEYEQDSEPPREKGWAASLAAVIAGWLVSGMTTFVAFSLSRTILLEKADWQAQSLFLVAGTAFVGGYVAGAMARRLPIVHGILVAILSIINAVLLETLWRVNAIETVMRPMTLLAWGLIIVGGVAGAVISVQLKQRATRSQPRVGRENDLYQDLLVKVRHDQGVADRLVALEHQRAPTSSRIELIKNAITRWERDNR